MPSVLDSWHQLARPLQTSGIVRVTRNPIVPLERNGVGKQKKSPGRERKYIIRLSYSRPSPDDSYGSIDPLLPKGMRRRKLKRTRPSVRHVNITTAHRGKSDKYDAIGDRLGGMEDKAEELGGRNTKIEQFTARAIRGLGAQKVVLGTGTYGPVLVACLRRQRRSEKDHLIWVDFKVPIPNRIPRSSPSGLFGEIPGGGADEVAISLGGRFAPDASKYRVHKWGGAKLEPIAQEPHTISRIDSAAMRQIRLFCLLYGGEHATERKKTLRKLRRLHGDKPELLTVSLIARWRGRLRFEYSGTSAHEWGR